MSLTSNVEPPAAPVASVETPVIIPFKYPVNVDVVPAPGMTASLTATVTPLPTTQPKSERLVVVIPRVWSPASSITQTFNPFAHEPGVFAAQL